MTPDPSEQVRAIASGVFFTLPQDEPSSAPPEAIDDWDSMQRLNLILALEEHFGVEFAIEEIEQIKTLADFCAVVQQKLRQTTSEPQG